jgi:hypothetical protein
VKSHLKLVVTETCDKFHMSPAQQQVINWAKALVRASRKAERDGVPTHPRYEHMLRLAVTKLEKEEKR